MAELNWNARAEPAIPAEITDEELVDLVKKGEESAFTLLYDRYFSRVYRFAYSRLRNREDSEETAQETFIAVFSSIESFRGEAPFAAWVLGVTRRVIASRFKKKRHITVPLNDEEPASITAVSPTLQREPTPLEMYECRERIGRLENAAINDLSSSQRLLFERHHLDHESIGALSSSLDQTEDSVKSNLYRARKILLER